jgi:hypothetical protein
MDRPAQVLADPRVEPDLERMKSHRHSPERHNRSVRAPRLNLPLPRRPVRDAGVTSRADIVRGVVGTCPSHKLSCPQVRLNFLCVTRISPQARTWVTNAELGRSVGKALRQANERQHGQPDASSVKLPAPFLGHPRQARHGANDQVRHAKNTCDERHDQPEHV